MDTHPVLAALPAEPTLESCGNDQHLLDLKLKGRELIRTGLELCDKDGWELVNDADDVTMFQISTADSSLNTIKR